MYFFFTKSQYLLLTLPLYSAIPTDFKVKNSYWEFLLACTCSCCSIWWSSKCLIKNRRKQRRRERNWLDGPWLIVQQVPNHRHLISNYRMVIKSSLSIHLSMYSTDIYWRVNNIYVTFLKNLNHNREDDIKTHSYYKRKTEIITVWVGLSICEVWWSVTRGDLKVIGAIKFKPERSEHIEIGRWDEENVCILVRLMWANISKETVD